MDETLYGDEPVATAGDRLRAARATAGLSLTDVAARTRIPLRQLEAVEQGRYDTLPSPTYAIGFAKAYARVVGADEVSIATAVRGEIARLGVRQPEYAPYEMPDPARVPSRGLVVVAAGAALAVLILLALWYGTDLFRGGRSSPAPEATTAAPLSSPASSPASSPVATAVPAASRAPAPAPTGGLVRLTATARVWLRVYDADDKTLYLGTMDAGGHFDVPADAKGPMVNIGRPDKLAVTLDGRPVPPLGASDHAVKDVKVDGASIAAKLAAAGAPTPTPTSSPGSSPSPMATSRSRREDRSSREDSRPGGSRRSGESDTQRANLEAATPPAATGNATP